jgi:hypothetical protein
MLPEICLNPEFLTRIVLEALGPESRLVLPLIFDSYILLRVSFWVGVGVVDFMFA